MIQALHAILGDENSTTEKVKMLYGSRSSNDILGESMLNQWSESHSNKLEVTHVLSHEEPDDCKLKSSAFKRGFIDRALVEETFPSPEKGKDVLIFVCGPPVMYDVLCGPRTSKEVTGILGDIGYTADQVFKF
jgi:cytochrome-b5 reductase